MGKQELTPDSPAKLSDKQAKCKKFLHAKPEQAFTPAEVANACVLESDRPNPWKPSDWAFSPIQALIKREMAFGLGGGFYAASKTAKVPENAPKVMVPKIPKAKVDCPAKVKEAKPRAIKEAPAKPGERKPLAPAVTPKPATGAADKLKAEIMEYITEKKLANYTPNSVGIAIHRDRNNVAKAMTELAVEDKLDRQMNGSFTLPKA
jgi:hypothetical protein